jgi:hypothetical protein
VVSTPDQFHDFFVASAGVAGALVGLLFVAVSVTLERFEEKGETQMHRLRAAAALTAFSNALTVSLFALIPDVHLGWAAASVAVIGSLFVIASLLSLVRLVVRTPSDLTSGLFLVGLQLVFVFQLLSGISLIGHPEHDGPYETLCILVVVCFVVGISRSWELIGGPSIGFARELRKLARHEGPDEAESGEDEGAEDD